MVKTKATPLIPTIEPTIEFPRYKPVHKTTFVGSIEGVGVYFGDEVCTILIKDRNTKDTTHLETTATIRTVKFKDAKFYNGSKELNGEVTSSSEKVNELVRQYLDAEGQVVEATNVEGLTASLIKDGMFLCQEYKSILTGYLSKYAKCEVIPTLADGYENNVLKVEDNTVMVLATLCTIYNNDFIYIPLLSKALDILSNANLRACFDSKGRFAIFTSNTAVILPNIKNEELKGCCTEPFDKDTAFCGLLIHKDKTAVKGACDDFAYNIEVEMDTLFNKKITSTPIVSELWYGGEWQKTTGATVTRKGVNFAQVAEAEQLVIYESKEGMLLLVKKKEE